MKNFGWVHLFVVVLALGAACARSDEADADAAAGGAPTGRDGGAGASGAFATGGASSAGAGGAAGRPVINPSAGTSGAAGTGSFPCAVGNARLEAPPSELPAACTFAFPEEVLEGTSFDAELVNVTLQMEDDGTEWAVEWVSGEPQCEEQPGWYFADDAPVLALCPESCDALIRHGGGVVVVQFGCTRRVRLE